MIDIKKLNGVMDTDSPNENIGQSSIKMGRNIRYRGDKGNLQIQNIVGNTLLPYNQAAGANEGIGAFYDELRQRIFGFIYNSNGTHSIRVVDLSDLSVTALITNGTNTDGNILDFSLDEPIYNVKMLYGDDEQGDTLYFNDSSKAPCQINIERTLAGTFGVMKREFLEVIKYPANRPPYVIYGDDATVTVNTFRKKLFRFKTRAIYYSREKSVTSMQSELPLPINAQDTDIDKDPTKNCKVSIVYETLDADVEKIEILGAVSQGNQFSDFFLIQTIDKAAEGLNDNDIATFVFYNNQAYTEIDPEDSIQLFDLVPLEANSLEFLNGNVPIYGGITEGFNLPALQGSTTASTIPEIDTQLPYIFVGSQSGDSAFGTGNIHLVLIGSIQIGYSFTFITTNETITFVATVATTANVINGLLAAAVLAGFTVVSSDSENLVIVKTGESLQEVVRESPILTVTNSYSYNWNDKEAFGVVYFDKAGRTNGVVTKVGMGYQTANYTETIGVPNIPQISLSITSRPADWAYYYSVVRTKSLAKLNFLYWITDTTFKDTEFAYFSIENLNTFITNNPNSKFLAYDFSAGDRVRFIKVLSGSVNTVYVDEDFEIIGQILAPTINGIKRTGQFLKIALPTTSATFDFGTTAFYNYQIELYTPAQSVANSLNKFYEIGERYTIGNPTEETRYHQGMIQNQTANLSQPATFIFNKGDFYYRERRINVGAEYNYLIHNYEQGLARTTQDLNFVSQTYVDPNITPGSSLSLSLAGFDITTNVDRAILNVTAGTYTFRMKGAITVTFNDFGENFSFFLQDSNLNQTYLVPPQPIAQGPHTFDFDVTFQMIGPSRMFIFAYSEGDFRNSKSYSQTEVKITRELPYTASIIDANYSDYFASAVNSNGRAFVEQPESTRGYNPILLRWGRPNIINSNINEVSRFTPLNFDEIDLTKGDIEVLSAENRILNVLQKRGCGWYGIYSKIIQDNTGANVIATTHAILTKNNIQYLAGTFGIGNQKGSFAKTKLGYFFTDPVRGYQIRRSVDGLTPISELYYGQYFIRPIITKYNNDYIKPNGAVAKMLGYYDYFEEQYVLICPSGALDGETIPNNNFSFNELRNAYCAFYDFNPEWIICAQDTTFSWKNGQVYIHNNETNYGEFYGVQTYPSVKLVFNSKEALKRVFDAIAYQSNQIWVAPLKGDINTSMINPQTGMRQESSLISSDFDIQENVRYAALLRDMNSKLIPREALNEGDFLNGNWIEVNLTYLGSEFCFLYSPYVLYQQNPRTF